MSRPRSATRHESGLALMEIALSLLALAGHTGVWTTFVNRIHATRLPKPGIHAVNLIGLGSLCVLPLVYVWWLYHRGFSALWSGSNWVDELARGYFLVCCVLGVVNVAIWSRRQLMGRRVPAVRSESHSSHDMVERLGYHPLGSGLARVLTRLPGNECFRLELSEKELVVPRLSTRLDGLSISHLSDIHFAGAIDKQFFVEVMEMTNRLESDLILVTGDLVDKASCIDWVEETFGRLRAPHGVYFIFGNHDIRLKKELIRLRQRLLQVGLRYLGGRWSRNEINDTSVILAGNELPWLKPAADLRSCPPRREDPEALRILLSHSPDQYPWARERDFDLMLAGHNHGGQIRLPLIGPLFSPSRYGVRYASGTFYEAPTVMHVSRGISALDPLRYNCPPELARLVLRSPKPSTKEQSNHVETPAVVGSS